MSGKIVLDKVSNWVNNELITNLDVKLVVNGINFGVIRG